MITIPATRRALRGPVSSPATPQPTAKQKKLEQLGMDPGTAAHRLRTDILWGFVKAANHLCYRCGKPMTRETFSIDHIVPWLDSDSPHTLFFDSNNIAYSHLACNVQDARRPNRISDEEFAAMTPQAQSKLLYQRAVQARREGRPGRYVKQPS